MKKIKKWSKKKKCIVLASAVCVLLAGAVVGVRMNMRKSIQASAKMTVQSATAETGSVSTTVVGTGTLQGSSETNVKIPSAIEIEEIFVENGDEVKAGDALASVNEVSVFSALLEVKENIESVEDAIDALSSDASDSSTTEYLKKKVLESQLESLEETETFLESMMETNTIVATKDGIISAVNVSEGSESGASIGGTNGELQASVDVDVTTASVLACATEDTYGITFLSTSAEEDSEDHTENLKEVTQCTLNIQQPATGETPQTELEETEEFTGELSWDCEGKTFQASTVYTATIQLTAKEGYSFAEQVDVQVPGATVTKELRQSDRGEWILYIEAKFSKTAAKTTEQKNTDTSENATNITSEKKNGSAGNKEASGTSGTATAGQSSSRGTTSVSETISEAVSASEAYEVDEVSAFTIVSSKEVMVSINVDELDILTVQEGQTATVTLDAVDGESFEGTITDVSHTAVSGGNSVKYPVEITLDKTDDMLIGMSASATIIIEETEGAVVIPVSALQEKGNSVFVYTEQDSDGNLSGEVEVEVGLSNGTQVEITSGLEEGDVVYYLKSESTNDNTGNGFMGSGDMPGGGDMPSAGEMPGMGEKPDKGDMPGGGNQGGDQR